MFLCCLCTVTPPHRHIFKPIFNGFIFVVSPYLGRPSSSTRARRGYKTMMSGNKFRVKECIIVQGAHGEATQEKKKRKRKRRTSKRKRRKPLCNATSRADRTAAAAASSTSDDNGANTSTGTGANVA